MGKYKNKCLVNFQIPQVVEYLEELGYQKSGGVDLAWALAILTDPETTTYRCLNSIEIVNLSKLPREEKPRFAYSFEEFQSLVSELDPDYVEPEAEPEQEETAEQPEPEVVAEAPKPKRTRKKKTEPETETTKSEEND